MFKVKQMLTATQTTDINVDSVQILLYNTSLAQLSLIHGKQTLIRLKRKREEEEKSYYVTETFTDVGLYKSFKHPVGSPASSPPVRAASI